MADNPLPRVYAISGDQPVLIREAIEELKSRARIEPGSFDHADLDGTEANAGSILHSVMTAPFMSERRSAIVRRAERLREADAEELAEFLPKLPPYALLVLVFEPTEEGSRGTLLKAAAKKAGLLQEIKTPERSQVASRLRSRLKEVGFRVGSGAVEALSDLTGDDLSDAMSELEKLIAYCWEKKAIEVSDVRRVVLPSREYRVFTLLDAICSGSLGGALRELDVFLESSGRVESAAMRSLFPLLHRQLRLLFQARALRDAGLRLGDPAAERMQPALHRWQDAAQKSDFVRRKVEAFAARLTLADTARLFRCLLEADMRLKGQMSSAFHAETIERMVAEMCEIVQAGVSSRTATHV